MKSRARFLASGWAAALVALFASGCAAHNRLGLQVAIERGGYDYGGEALEWWAGVPAAARDAKAPVLVLVEGDGGRCQEFSERLWTRFLVSNAGRFALVRPRTLVNTACAGAPERWRALDFLHRVDELAALLSSVRRRLPDRPVVLLGHSAGAHVAVLYARRHPGEVSGLVNVSGGLNELSSVLADLEGEPAGRGAARAVGEGPRLPPDAPYWGRTARFWSQMLFSGVLEHWLAYREPCLVLHGTEDRASVPWPGVERDASRVRAAGGSCRLEPLAGAGHDTLTPSTFARIDAWLRSTWPGP